jgi:hypothetical protein
MGSDREERKEREEQEDTGRYSAGFPYAFSED